MKCIHCNGEKFEKRPCPFSPEIRNETAEVIVPAFVCTDCQSTLMNDEQMSALRRAAADKYRQKHNLLTSKEIIQFRTMLGMSQVAFANYLSVGEASIKRWETYFVQDPVQDEHIRLKCDEAYAELNALEVHWKSHPPDLFNGYRVFSWELFKQASCYLIGFAKSPLFLNKALFYADFLHFQRHDRGITGARYVHLEYGPCPDQYQILLNVLLRDQALIPSGDHELKSTKKPQLNIFDDAEKETLLLVANLAKKDGGKKLLKASHEEPAFKKTGSLQSIRYDFAKELKLRT